MFTMLVDLHVFPELGLSTEQQAVLSLLRCMFCFSTRLVCDVLLLHIYVNTYRCSASHAAFVPLLRLHVLLHTHTYNTLGHTQVTLLYPLAYCYSAPNLVLTGWKGVLGSIGD